MMRMGEPRDPEEPRFAGPPTASMRTAPSLPPWSTESPVTWSTAPDTAGLGVLPPPASSPPPDASGLEPVVDYGPGAQLPVAPRDGLALSRAGCAVAAAGGLLAVIGSFLTWATLRLTANGADSQGFSAQPSSITYNGLSLLEGRIILVLGILAIGLSAAAVPRRAHRLLPLGMAITGAIGVIVMAFAAIGHPVELATLFRSYRQIDAVKVNLPNGAGTWLAVIGALLVLAGGLLALMRGSGMAAVPGQQGEERE
jgi:hypothetical protein